MFFVSLANCIFVFLTDSQEPNTNAHEMTGPSNLSENVQVVSCVFEAKNSAPNS